MINKITALTVFSIVQMLTSFASQVFIAIYLGATWERDALFVAMSIPLFINTLLVSTIGVIITPSMLRLSSIRGERRMAIKVMTQLAVVTVPLVWILHVVRNPVLKLLVPGFAADHRLFAAELFAEASWLIPIQAVTSIVSGYLLARDRVFLPSTTLILGNATTVAIIVLVGGSLTAEHVVLATLAGAALALAIQFMSFLTENKGKEPGRGDSEDIGDVYGQALPLVFSGLVSRSTPFVERYLASSLSIGTISCLGYAGSLMTFLLNATLYPIATIYYARMCNLWNRGEREEVGRLLERNLVIIMTIALALGGLFIVGGGEMLQVLLQNSKFTAANISELITYSNILMIPYIFLSCGGLVSRLFYVTGASRQMAFLDCFGTVFYIIAAGVLVRIFAGRGLALAVSLQAIFATGLFVLWARRQFKSRLRGEFVAELSAILVKWSLVFAGALAIKHLSQPGMSAISGTAIATVAYVMGAAWMMRVVWRKSGVRWREEGTAE